jgi:hypothetical protein
MNERRILLRYVPLGVFLGIVFTKGEVISWFRIQEMFRFQSFHMYGIIGSAVAVAALATWLIKHRGMRALGGGEIETKVKPSAGLNYRYWIGNGVSVMFVALFAALAGAWAYGYFAPRLPHH